MHRTMLDTPHFENTITRGLTICDEAIRLEN
jgi:hypothetical protein